MQLFNLKSNGCEFLVMDSQKIHNSNLNESYVSSISNKFIDRIYEATVFIFKLNLKVSMTSNWNKQYTVKTHLGSMTKIGAYVMGYDIGQINAEEIEDIKNYYVRLI